jgi:hypothetical protein
MVAAVAREATHSEELAEEATAEATSMKEMARDQVRWMRTWRRRGAAVRSTSSRTSAATAPVWLAARQPVRARSMLSVWVGQMEMP